jgi:putative endonuclease
VVERADLSAASRVSASAFAVGEIGDFLGMYFIYILKSLKDYGYYVGSTANLEERLKRHNQGRSAATKSRRPWELVYSKRFKSKNEAIKLEYYIKKQKSSKFIKEFIKK